jgi:HlyD family secretion protein
VGGVAVIAVGTFLTRGDDNGRLEWDTATAEVRSLTISASATGVVEPVRRVEVKSKAAGEVVAMSSDTGDVVETGSILAQVETDLARQQLRQAQADLDVARARREVSDTRLSRAKRLKERQFMSAEDYESAVLDAANAKAQLVRAEAELQLAKERLDDTTVRAPIDGTIIERSVEKGQIIASSMSNVSGGTTLMVMADLGEVQVRTQMDETDIGRVSKGQGARVTVDAYPDRTFEGVVDKVEPKAVVIQNVTTFSLLIRLQNEDGLLLPGMNADVEIIFRDLPDVLTVPVEALKAEKDVPLAAVAVGLDPENVLSVFGGEGDGPEAGREGQEGPRPGKAEGRPRRGGKGGPGRGGRMGRGGRPGGPGMKGRRGGSGGRGGWKAGRESVGQESAPQDMVAFVKSGDNVEARKVVAGASNWDHFQVISGLQAGDEVLVLPSGHLQAQQEELKSRYKRWSSLPGMKKRGRR